MKITYRANVYQPIPGSRAHVDPPLDTTGVASLTTEEYGTPTVSYHVARYEPT